VLLAQLGLFFMTMIKVIFIFLVPLDCPVTKESEEIAEIRVPKEVSFVYTIFIN
jgi:hypothetical protein